MTTASKKKKKKDQKAIMACGTCMARNYSIAKSVSFIHDRLELKKYCSKCTAHTMHRETR
jgi:large subunit ribosomal protein L33